jgi:transposase-like protein
MRSCKSVCPVRLQLCEGSSICHHLGLLFRSNHNRFLSIIKPEIQAAGRPESPGICSEKHDAILDNPNALMLYLVPVNGIAICPHCGATKRIGKLRGKSYRIGLYKRYACRKQFNVKMGTIFEDSHVPLDGWISAIYLIGASKKGISSNRLHSALCVSLKTAWRMSHQKRRLGSFRRKWRSRKI